MGAMVEIWLKSPIDTLTWGKLHSALQYWLVHKPECTSFHSSYWPQHLSTLSINSLHHSNLRTERKKLPQFVTFTASKWEMETSPIISDGMLPHHHQSDLDIYSHLHPASPYGSPSTTLLSKHYSKVPNMLSLEDQVDRVKI